VNRIYLLPVTFVFMMAASLACSAETVNVKMKSLSYDPKELAIRLGDSVTWSRLLGQAPSPIGRRSSVWRRLCITMPF
jgi:hypothetical protein